MDQQPCSCRSSPPLTDLCRYVHSLLLSSGRSQLPCTGPGFPFLNCVSLCDSCSRCPRSISCPPALAGSKIASNPFGDGGGHATAAFQGCLGTEGICCLGTNTYLLLGRLLRSDPPVYNIYPQHTVCIHNVRYVYTIHNMCSEHMSQLQREEESMKNPQRCKHTFLLD